MSDSMRRECNLIIKGLKKSEQMPSDVAASNENASSVSSEIAVSNDLAIVTEILSNLKSAAKLVNLNLDNIYVKRIGTRKSFVY